MKLKCPQKRKKAVKLPALEHLRDRSRSQEYGNKIVEKYYSCGMDQDPSNIPLEDQWKCLKDAITEVSFEVLGERGRKKKAEHLSKETKDLLQERGMVKKRPSNDENRSEYSRLNGLVRQSCKRDDNEHATQENATTGSSSVIREPTRRESCNAVCVAG